MAIIPFDQRDGQLWFDGKFVPWRDARTHVLTHGLHYASSVFEGVRMYNGRVFKLEEHTQRLFESARILDMKIPFGEDEINRACVAACEVQGLKDAYIRPVVYRGSEMMSVAAPFAKIHVAIAAWQWDSYFHPNEKMKGIRMNMSEWRRPAPDTIPWKSKAAGLYMICTLSKHAAEAAGYHDSLMLDYRGLVAEATGANIFFAKDGKLHTPVPDCFLDGITRRTVIALAKARQIPVIERQIKPEELPDFEECFLCGTAAEVTPVREIAPRTYTPGPICEAMMNDYADEVRRAATIEKRLSASG
ncbi:MAG: branched-chain amino acid aminotransferase [Alphaproteobacteria bacterium]